MKTRHWTSWARTAGLVGLVVWLATWLGPEVGMKGTDALVSRLLMFAPLVLVPWGIALAGEGEPHDVLLRGALALWAPCAGAAVYSMYLPHGMLAAALGAAWAIPTGLVGLDGARRGVQVLRKQRPALPEELCMIAGMLYLPGAVVWWTASRYGYELMDFPLTIVQLTSIHFHYAGFTAPLLCALTGRALRSRQGSSRATRAYALVAAIVALGTPLIAAGITFSPTIEMISTVIFSLGLLGVSIATLVTLRELPSLPSKVLLGASSLSLFVSMAAASNYALRYIGAPPVTIAEMAIIHGVVNCLGFAGAGVAGWTLAAMRRPRHNQNQDHAHDPL